VKQYQKTEETTRKRRLASIENMMSVVKTICKRPYSDDSNVGIVTKVKSFLGFEVPTDISASAGTLIRCGTEVKMGSTFGMMVSLLCKCFFLGFF